MSVEHHLLFAVLAFEDELIDLQQLTAACRAWAGDKSKPLADLLVEQGWVAAEDRSFLEKKADRKLARHQNDPRVTLNSVARGDVCDVLRKEVDDSEVRQSLSSWPSDAPVLIETIGQTMDESQQPKTRYTWISEVGAGGLGKVWLARDNDLSREVALKEIKPGSASSEAVRRLIKEAQITGQLQHPGIVPVYEVSHDGRPFYTMKLVRGETLSRAIREHHEQKRVGDEDPLSERRLLNVFLNVCDAIAYAHSRGVIHRDLKPDNVVLGEYGEAIVLDWGLARQMSSDDEDSAPIVVTEDGRTDATQAGQKLGTPAYMSPEQASGRVEHMDERTDIYGLGAILFEILTGQSPHRRIPADSDASNIAAMLNRIATEPTPQAQSIDESIPDELAAICGTAMSKHRTDRYQTARDLKQALLEFQVHEESIELTARADADLTAARQTGNYEDFSRARFGFEAALEQWPENVQAAFGLTSTRRDFARTAFDRGDFDLALTLLDGTDAVQAELAPAIHAAIQERASREQRIRRLRQFGISTSATIAALAIVAAVWINSERNKAIDAQRDEAVQRSLAQQREREAQTQRAAAVRAGQKTEAERQKAVAAQKSAERNAYRSDMLLAQRDWQDANIGHLRELLRKYRDRDDLKGFEWGYWNRLVNSDLLTLRGHGSGVNCVCVSPDGRTLASGSLDDTVKLWDVETGRELKTLTGHSGPVHCVSFSADGKQLVSSISMVGYQKPAEIKVWNVETGQEVQSLSGHSGGVESVCFSPDGARIVSGGGDAVKPSEIKVWDVNTGTVVLSLNGHSSSVASVGFSPDGKQIVSGGHDHTVRLWDADTGQNMAILKGHAGGVVRVVFSADGKRIVSGSYDHSVKVWDVESGQEIHSLEGHSGSVNGVAFSPDGTRIVTGSYDRTVRVWDTNTGQELSSFKGHVGPVPSVSFSPDGNWIVSGGVDGTLKLWDPAVTQESLQLNGHDSSVHSLAVSPNGKRIVSGDSLSTVKVWDMETGQELLTRTGKAGIVRSLAFSPDSRQIASEIDGPGTLTLWDADSGLDTHSLSVVGDAKFVSAIASVDFSEDGGRILTGGWDSVVRVWDTVSGKLIHSFKTASSVLDCVQFSPDGKWIAGCAVNGLPKIWDSKTGKDIRTLRGHTLTARCLDFSRDGKRLATGSWDSTVKIWNAETGRELRCLRGHTQAVTSVRFSPDGQQIVTSSHDLSIKLWDTETGEELLTLAGHTGSVSGVEFSSDGLRIVSGSLDKSVRIWDSRPWENRRVQPEQVVVIASGESTVQLKLPEALFQQKLSQLKSQGHQLAHLSVTPASTGAGFHGIWKTRSASPVVVRHGLAFSEIQDAAQELAATGFRMTSVSGYEEAGSARYAAIWKKESGPEQVFHSGLSREEFSKQHSRMLTQGFRIAFLDGFAADGSDQYAAVWEKRNDVERPVRVGMTSDEYQAAFEQFAKEHRLVHVSCYTIGAKDFYSAVWEPGPGPQFASHHQLPLNVFRRLCDDYSRKGFHLVHIDGCQIDGEAHFAAIWTQREN